MTESRTTTSETTTCRSCGRRITATKSVQQGRGRVCQARFDARVAQAATVEKADQLARAIELIEDGGLQRFGHLFLAVSSDGKLRYECAATGECTCKAAYYGRRCYHVVAAALVA